MPGHAWKPGQSGNPAGRPPMPVEVREAIRANGRLGVERMRQLLMDDTAWGPKGWIDAKTQVKLAEVAITKGYGSHPLEHPSAAPGGEGGGSTSVLREVYDALREELGAGLLR